MDKYIITLVINSTNKPLQEDIGAMREKQVGMLHTEKKYLISKMNSNKYRTPGKRNNLAL